MLRTFTNSKITGLSLERMDDLFGVTELALKVEAQHDAEAAAARATPDSHKPDGSKHIEDAQIREVRS